MDKGIRREAGAGGDQHALWRGNHDVGVFPRGCDQVTKHRVKELKGNAAVVRRRQIVVHRQEPPRFGLGDAQCRGLDAGGGSYDPGRQDADGLARQFIGVHTQRAHSFAEPAWGDAAWRQWPVLRRGCHGHREPIVHNTALPEFRWCRCRPAHHRRGDARSIQQPPERRRLPRSCTHPLDAAPVGAHFVFKADAMPVSWLTSGEARP